MITSNLKTRRSWNLWKQRERLARLIAGGPEPEAHRRTEPAATPSAIRLRLKEFETSTVRDVMTSRVDIAAVEATATIGEVLSVFATEAHSRMPVFRAAERPAFG